MVEPNRPEDARSAPGPAHEAPTFDPAAPGFYEDPYPFYRALRDLDPIHRTEAGPWFLTRWADCRRVLRTAGATVDLQNAGPRRRQVTQRNGGALRSTMQRSRDVEADGTTPMFRFSPDSARLRRVLPSAFNQQSIDRLRDRVAAVAADLVTRVGLESGQTDLMAAFAYPLPFQIIHEFLGLPPSDDDNRLRTLCLAVSDALDPILAAVPSVNEPGSMFDELSELVTRAVEWKRSRPADDLLSALLQADGADGNLTDGEVRDNVILLLIAGLETSVNLLGNGIVALLRHPDQADRLRADAGLESSTIEELLRFDAPVQVARRIALTQLDVGGRRIEPGDTVLIGLGAANRDPAKFGTTAEHLDLSRRDARNHLSFGGGAHRCLGAALARLEAAVALPLLLRRYPSMTLVGDGPSWAHRLVLRGPLELPVELGPRAPEEFAARRWGDPAFGL